MVEAYNKSYGGTLKSVSDVLIPTGKTVVHTSRYLPLHGQSFDRQKYYFSGKDQFTQIFKGKKERKLIFVSLGTLFNDNLEFFKAAISSFSKLPDFRILISTGGN